MENGMSDGAEPPAASTRLRAALALLDDQVWFLDARDRIVAGAGAASDSEACFLDRIGPDERADAAAWLTWLREGRAVARLYTSLAEDDDARVEWQGRRVDGTDELVVVGRDLSEAYLAQRQRSEQAVLVEMLAEHEAVFSLDRDGGFLQISGALRRLLGFEERVGNPHETWMSRVHPHDLDPTLETWARMFAPDPPDGVELTYRYQHPDRGLRWLLLELRSLFDERGEPWRVVGRVADVTEEQERVAALEQSRDVLERAVEQRTVMLEDQARQLSHTNAELLASERRLETAQRIAHVGSWTWNIAAGTIDWSAETFRIFGHEPYSFEPTYAGFLEQVVVSDRSAVEEAVARSAETGEPYEIEHGILRPDGSRRVVRERGEVSADPSGVRWMVGVCQDVTELRGARDRLVRAVEERDALLREVHHRVKNNLQIVSSLLYLRGSSLPAEAREPFEDSRVRVQAMALVHETLYQSGRFDRVAVHRYLERLLEGTRETWLGAGSEISLRRSFEPAWLDLDRAPPLGLLVVELVSNALKHAFPSGEGQVELSLWWMGDDTLELRVEDDGVGLPDDAWERGLGLSLVSGLMDQLQAQMDVTVDRGTCYRIRMPAPGGQRDAPGG